MAQGHTLPSVKIGTQEMYRCPACGSLVDVREWRCFHGENDLYGHDRVPVRVTVEEV